MPNDTSSSKDIALDNRTLTAQVQALQIAVAALHRLLPQEKQSVFEDVLRRFLDQKSVGAAPISRAHAEALRSMLDSLKSESGS